MSIERPRPYVGISGVGNSDQEYYLLDQFAHQGLDGPPINRQIALGVKAVHKTQYLDIENKYGQDWYPVGERAFASALDGESAVSLQVAQTYLDIDHVHDAQYRKEFVDRICKRGKSWLNAIQFDMLPWHEDGSMLDFLENVKEETGHTIMLQAHGEAMRELGPAGIVRTLGQSAAALDYILFDASHGKGVRMDPTALRPFLDAAYSSDALSATGVSIAGGLNADVVREDLPTLLEEFPDVSWDAEGQLHPFQPHGTRPLDMKLVNAYLEASSEVLRKV